MDLVVAHKLDISSNMEELAENIKKDIQNKYDIIVTEDSLPETKKLMAEVNKDKNAFKEKYKEFKDEVLAPLVPLDVKAKEIEGYFDNARLALDNQVKNFEKGKLEAIKVIVEKYRDDACLTANITPESIIVTDLVILSAVNVNSKGYSIAKKVSDTIDQRIQFVENQILKAKLEAEEKAKRDREIAENARREAEERARVREAELLAKAERDKAEAVERARQEVKQVPPTIAENAQVEPIKEPTFTDDVSRIFMVTATFQVEAKASIPKERISAKLKSMIESAGITSLKSIEVE